MKHDPASALAAKRLIAAVRMVWCVSHAGDDVVALDTLKEFTQLFREQSLFTGTVQAAEFLASLDIEQWMAEPEVWEVVTYAGLSEWDVRMARAWAFRFRGVVDG